MHPLHIGLFEGIGGFGLAAKWNKTLRVSDIPSSRLLFRLVPSARPTAEIGFGLLPTPTAQEGKRGAQVVAGKKKTRPSGQTFSASLGDMGKSKLLPTPRASGEENYETRAKRKGHGTAMSYLQENIQYKTGSTSQLSPSL